MDSSSGIFNENRKILLVKEHETAPRKYTTKESTNYLYMGFRILGIYMPDQYKLLYIIYSFILNTISWILLPMSFTVSLLTVSTANVEIGRFFTSLQVSFDIYAVAIKVIIIGLMLKKLSAADAVMKRLDARCQEEDEISELVDMGRFGRKSFKLFAVAYFTYSTCTLMSSLFFGSPPYSIYIPYIDWRHSTWEFVVATSIEYITMTFACFQQVCVDSYGVVYVCILRTHMKILLLRVRKLGTKKSNTIDDNLKELKLCVLDHKALLELHGIIAPIISTTIFTQFMVTAFMLGIALINVLLFATDVTAIVASSIFMGAVCVEIFPLCYYAQCLIEDSNRLAQEIFHSDWVDMGTRYGKMLAFFMQHTQRQMELYAGKVFPITLNTFLSIGKFSFTLFTFIREMDIKSKIGK